MGGKIILLFRLFHNTGPKSYAQRLRSCATKRGRELSSGFSKNQWCLGAQPVYLDNQSLQQYSTKIYLLLDTSLCYVFRKMPDVNMLKAWCQI
uniref:Uncharacterized protein n=1 Tax=Arundo donax TaxID=35708 RepID=A0A0A9BYD5_ARUDO